MKKTLILTLCLLLALCACAAAEAGDAQADATAARALGDGYALTYDATALSYYRDGVMDGVDLVVPTQDVTSPAYLMISRLEDVQAELDSFTSEGYTDAGETALASGLSARTFTLTREEVNYRAYIVEGNGRAYTLMTVCASDSAQTEAQLTAVVNSFELDDTALAA